MIWGQIWKKYRKSIGYLLLFALPFGALFLDEIRLPKTFLVQKIDSWIVHPIAGSIHNSVGGFTYIFKNYLALRKVKESNEILLKENDRLRQEILQLKEAGLENTRLYGLLELRKSLDGKGRTAQVIGEDASPDRFAYLINIGRREGVEVRAPVLTTAGLVGQVREVYDHSALVLTLLDPASTADAVDTRSRAHALIEGTGKDYLARTKFVDRIEDFRVGDLMLSSGIDGIYPKGHAIGTIVEVQKPAQGVLQTAFLRPAVDYDKLEEVLVLAPLAHDSLVQITNQTKGQSTAR